MDETFLPAFLPMESNDAVPTSVPQITWPIETEASFHVAVDASFSYSDIGVALENAAIVPTPHGTSWMDSSLSGALEYMHPHQVPDADLHAAEILSGPSPVSSCKIVTDTSCTQPIDGTISSVKWHLWTHGHRHQRKDVVQCPWAECPDKLRWMNVPRHIRSIHLGVRMVCPTCKRSFTRPLGLTKHVASKRCSLV